MALKLKALQGEITAIKSATKNKEMTSNPWNISLNFQYSKDNLKFFMPDQPPILWRSNKEEDVLCPGIDFVKMQKSVKVRYFQAKIGKVELKDGTLSNLKIHPLAGGLIEVHGDLFVASVSDITLLKEVQKQSLTIDISGGDLVDLAEHPDEEDDSDDSQGDLESQE